MVCDYSETGRVNLFEDHPLYRPARARAEAIATASAQTQKAERAICEQKKLAPHLQIILDRLKEKKEDFRKYFTIEEITSDEIFGFGETK